MARKPRQSHNSAPNGDAPSEAGKAASGTSGGEQSSPVGSKADAAGVPQPDTREGAEAPVPEIRTAPGGEEQSSPLDPDPEISAPIVAVVIFARQPVRRRVGRLFTPEAVRIPVSDLSDEELAALAGDPMLDVKTETGAVGGADLMHVQV